MEYRSTNYLPYKRVYTAVANYGHKKILNKNGKATRVKVPRNPKVSEEPTPVTSPEKERQEAEQPPSRELTTQINTTSPAPEKDAKVSFA